MVRGQHCITTGLFVSACLSAAVGCLLAAPLMQNDRLPRLCPNRVGVLLTCVYCVFMQLLNSHDDSECFTHIQYRRFPPTTSLFKLANFSSKYHRVASSTVIHLPNWFLARLKSKWPRFDCLTVYSLHRHPPLNTDVMTHSCASQGNSYHGLFLSIVHK